MLQFSWDLTVALPHLFTWNNESSNQWETNCEMLYTCGTNAHPTAFTAWHTYSISVEFIKQTNHLTNILYLYNLLSVAIPDSKYTIRYLFDVSCFIYKSVSEHLLVCDMLPEHSLFDVTIQHIRMMFPWTSIWKRHICSNLRCLTHVDLNTTPK